MLKEYLKFAESLAKKGGVILTNNFGTLNESDIENKGAHDVVTKVDKDIEKMYVEEIKKAFPGHGIIGEEGTSENLNEEFVWVLDPLDGTKNFTIENPFFCTSICLLKNKEPVVAVIYEPITNNIYSATKGGGTFKNKEKTSVSNINEAEKAMILYCHAATPQAIKEAEHYVVGMKLAFRDAARLRSAGCEMALVAKGVSEAYMMNNLPLWDLAAGALLVREAGGKATDFTGKDWYPGSNNIIVSNGTKIHEKMIEIISK